MRLKINIDKGPVAIFNDLLDAGEGFVSRTIQSNPQNNELSVKRPNSGVGLAEEDATDCLDVQ